MNKTPIEINLLGQRIALKAIESDTEMTSQVIELVTARLKEAEIRSKGGAAHQVTLLALFDLAEEYIQAKKRTLEYQGRVQSSSQRLSTLLGPG